MMKTLPAVLLALSVFGGSSFSAMAADHKKGAASVEEIIHETLTVQAVDVPNRRLTVKDDAGTVHTMEVSREVKNLPQIKAGDLISVAFKMGLAAEIKKPGATSPGVETRESIRPAPAGAKPGGTAAFVVTALITVKEVDAAKNLLTFEDTQARTRTIRVVKPEMQKLLKQVKPGDQVEVAYTEELAVKVQPATR
jgi:translation elongation factor P/translation initiation factor 5A